jgi:prepilin-type N-terminal cleavage/methylation domain-containing protein
MKRSARDDAGFSLVETMVSMLVLSVGVLGLSQAFVLGVQKALSSPYEVLATQKAAEAIESVFAARDSHTIAWAQMKNVADGGVFVGAATPMRLAGNDGVLNTADDGAIESYVFPGPDDYVGTPDDKTLTLDTFTRQIQIVELTPFIRHITVTITYPVNGQSKTYQVTALISQYA